MPENYSLPTDNAGENNAPNPQSAFGQTPQTPEPEQRFSPPPSNVFIRTSQSDLEKIKSEGGMVSGMPSASPMPATPEPAPEPAPAPDFSYNPPAPPASEPEMAAAPEFNAPQPSPAFSGSEPSFAPEAPMGMADFQTSEPEGQKSKLWLWLIIAAVVIGVGVLGYFYVWPRFFEARPAATSTTTTSIGTTTTTLGASPYPQVSGPFQKALFNIQVSGADIAAGIQEAAVSESAPATTFKVLVPKVHNDALTNEEVVMALIPNLPVRLQPFMLARKYLVYAYYGEVNPSLGLVIDVGAENKEDVKSVFSSWEKNLGILSDLQNLFLISVPKKSSQSFKDATNAGAEIRYFEYAGEEAAIAYAFYENYLIMSSSLESVNSAISHLQGVTEPIYP